MPKSHSSKPEMPFVVPLEKIEGFIFDLDGVITDTARIHFGAWKQMFDDFLKKRHDEHPFEDEDYRTYVDGKPRYDGVKDFLASRGISLPYGNEDDPEDLETICALGIRKNKYFLEFLDERGANVYQSSIEFINVLKKRGIKTAVISSSRNCGHILHSTGIEGLFDAKVDGLDLDDLNIQGKPDPSMLLEAARRIGVGPGSAAIVEDSLSGVEAGHRGGFAFVIGIARAEDAKRLKENGADIVVTDLKEFKVFGDGLEVERGAVHIPSALDSKGIKSELETHRLAIFLDYDGTLTEIVDNPSEAFISEETRSVLRSLSSVCSVAVISGRDVEDVMELVNVEGIVYAGSHGFDIITADGKRHDNPEWLEFMPFIERAEKELRNAMKGIAGVIVERKRFAISVHYRKVSPSVVPEVMKRFDEVSFTLPKLRKSSGKKVLEVLPDVDWNKGKALLFLLKLLRIERSGVLPIFIGDDLTDEDAFRAIFGTGIGILVGEVDRATYARYSLQSPTDVRLFLQILLDILKGRKE